MNFLALLAFDLLPTHFCDKLFHLRFIQDLILDILVQLVLDFVKCLVTFSQGKIMLVCFRTQLQFTVRGFTHITEFL